MGQRGGPPCGESSRNALLEDGGCLSGSGSCQFGDEGGGLLTPSAPYLYCKHDQMFTKYGLFAKNAFDAAWR